MSAIGLALFVIAFIGVNLESDKDPYSDNTKALFGGFFLVGITLMVASAAVFLWGFAP